MSRATTLQYKVTPDSFNSSLISSILSCYCKKFAILQENLKMAEEKSIRNGPKMAKFLGMFYNDNIKEELDKE